ncbi:MAG: peptidoglycan-binding domain-containing protein [Actinomycetota bacterium]|nr:peptidoglycan-binding domain-containing protein [Actinomycetota bacterium]
MRYRRGLAFMAVLALALAACSSDGGDTTTSTSTTFPTETTTATTTTTVPSTTTSSSSTTTTSPYGGATLTTDIIQQELSILGYFDGEPDGILGPLTEAALREFQTDAGITVDGEHGPETYEALADALEADEEFVVTVQEDLMEMKLYPGPADGDYGDGTVKGVEALQEQCEMEIDGRFTPQTHLCLEEEMGRL